MKADTFTKVFLWNKSVDSLVRVLQRIEALGIWSGQEMTAHEVRLEELRATVNAEFVELISAKERSEEHRFEGQRLAAEPDNSFTDQATTQIKHTKQYKHCFSCI